MSGEVVRLRQGKADQKTVYSSDPAAFARKWQDEGGDWLHLVDLDAAFSGEQRNLDSVRAITSAVTIPCDANDLNGEVKEKLDELLKTLRSKPTPPNAASKPRSCAT